MKRLIVLFGCVFLLFGSCQEPGRNKSGAGVIIKGGGEFPQFLAGRWKGDKHGWEFVFEPDGTISSVVISLGGVESRPNQTTRVQGRKGEPGIFEAGDFEVYYDSEYRELSVNIKIKRVYIDMGSIVEGTCEYFIIGDISEDEKIWQSDVFTLLDLVVLAPDPNRTTGEPELKEIGDLRSDFSEGAERVIFTKVENSGNNK